MNVDEGDLFLTKVDLTDNHRNSNTLNSLTASSSHYRQLLSQARKEHKKIEEVVEAFQGKVEKMIDKQRQEYVTAYEHHVQDVQKELYQLRQKVNQIANDRTKNERTEKLTQDLGRYKNEALELEADSNRLRVELSQLLRKIYTVEKDRDWMLKKLRQAKHQYTYLVKERARLQGIDEEMSESNGSSYTFEGADNGREQQERAIMRSLQRSPNQSARLPAIVPPGPPSSSIRQTSQVQNPSSKALTDLLTARARRDEVTEFLSSCVSNLHRRPFCKIERRPLEELVLIFQQKLQEHANQGMQRVEADEELVGLVCELAAEPDIYSLLTQLITSHRLDVARRNSPKSRKNSHNVLGISFAADDDEVFNDHHQDESFFDNEQQEDRLEDLFASARDDWVAQPQEQPSLARTSLSLDNLDIFMPKL